MPTWRNGRRDRFKIYCQQWRVGSSPAVGTMNINKLTQGEWGRVVECSDSRLLEHGCTPGTEILLYNKRSHIICICIRGAILACRQAELQYLDIEKLV